MSVAFQIGIGPLEFWELTPRELGVLVSAHLEKAKRDHEERLLIAYLGAYWQRIKKMPSIKEVLKQSGTAEPKQKTPEQLLEQVKRMNEALGGQTVRKGGE